MKKLLSIIFIGFFGFAGVAFALPYFSSTQTVVPFQNNTYDLGTSTAAWRKIYTNDIVISGTCTGCSAGSQTPWGQAIDGAGFALTNGGQFTLTNILATSTTASSTFPKLNFTTATGTQATTTTLAVTNVTSALMLTNGSGSVGGYAGTSCTNQFVRSLSALGAATCASVANTDLTNSSVTVTAGGGLAGGGSVALGSSVTLTNPYQISTSSPSIGQLAYYTSASPTTLGSVATGTISASGGITVTASRYAIGGAAAFACTAGTAAATGCIQSADWTKFNNKVGTSTTLVAGRLLMVDGNGTTVQSVATTSVGCSGFITCTGFTGLGAASTITTTGQLAIASGGTNASSYTLSNGIVAYDGTRLVNFTGYTLTSTGIVLTNASTTNESISGYINVPSGTSQTLTSGAGSIGVDTTNGEFLFNSGRETVPLTATRTMSFMHATTTTTGTTTYWLPLPASNVTVTRIRCLTNSGTATFDFYNGTASTSLGCSTSASYKPLTANNTFSTTTANVRIGVGSMSSAAIQVPVMVDYKLDQN